MPTMQALIGRTEPLTVSANDIHEWMMTTTSSGEVFGSSNALASGGTPPYSFSWAQISSAGQPITYTGTASQTLHAIRSGSIGQSTAVVRVTVQDAAVQQATDDISVMLELSDNR